MSKHEALPLMRTDISSKNAWAEFSPKFEDSANRRTSTTSLDGFGLAWALHSAERFQEIYGSAPRPRVHPGPAQGNAVQLAQWNVDMKDYTHQQEELIGLRDDLIRCVPAHHFKNMLVQKSMRTRSLEYMFTNLNTNLGTFTAVDIAEMQARLDITFVDGEPIEPFLATKNEIFEDYIRIGQPFSEFAKVEILKACFPAHFEDCWVNYARNRGTILLQTSETLCVAIINHVETILPLRATKGKLNMNVVTEQQSQIDALGRQLHEALSAISSQQHAKPQPARPRSGPAGKSGQPARAPVTPATFATSPFCWSHGPGHHTSDACEKHRQFPNHKTQATWAKQMGSSWRDLFKGQGRPIA